ncbi:hypothetical protein ACA910_006340, partial [Epithemia clementina (nom. ined.)]
MAANPRNQLRGNSNNTKLPTPTSGPPAMMVPEEEGCADFISDKKKKNHQHRDKDCGDDDDDDDDDPNNNNHEDTVCRPAPRRHDSLAAAVVPQPQQQQPQPKHPASDTTTMDCVNACFWNVLSLFCQSRPVALYWHNVHLADAASLNVIQYLATATTTTTTTSHARSRPQPPQQPRQHRLLLILTYRDDEVDEHHPFLTQTIAQIKQQDQEHQDEESLLATDILEDKSEKPIALTESHEETNADKKQPETKDEMKDKALSRRRPQRRPQRRRRVYDIEVKNLNVESVNDLVASLTKRSTTETWALSNVIHQKTHGNPFFVMHFLQWLRRQDDFFRYSYWTAQWEWGNVDQWARAAEVSDNVADVVAATLQRLPETTRVALSVAACLGKIIPQHVLMEWFDSHYEDGQVGSTCSTALRHIQQPALQAVLDQAVQVAILIRPKKATKTATTMTMTTSTSTSTSVHEQQQPQQQQQQQPNAYLWAHDKLQTVAYSLIPISTRPTLHLKLGRLLWSMSQRYPEEEWMVYMAAEQMNRYSGYQSQQQQQQQQRQPPNQSSGNQPTESEEILGAEVATLCLEAARLSLAKSALYPAYDMLQAGVKHLMNVPDKWSKHYDLCLSLYSTVAELSIQLGKRDQVFAA